MALLRTRCLSKKEELKAGILSLCEAWTPTLSLGRLCRQSADHVSLPRGREVPEYISVRGRKLRLKDPAPPHPTAPPRTKVQILFKIPTKRKAGWQDFASYSFTLFASCSSLSFSSLLFPLFVPFNAPTIAHLPSNLWTYPASMVNI